MNYQKHIKIFFLFFSLFVFFVGCTNKILYAPPQGSNKTINTPKKGKVSEITIKTKDGESIRCLKYSMPKSKNRDVILFLHGNADDIYITQELPLRFFSFGNFKYDIVSLDYRGYGKSSGDPSPKGLNLDIQATIKYLSENFTNIYIFAQSIGATSFLGSLDEIDKSKIRAIVTEGAFFSYRQLAEKLSIKVPLIDYKELEKYAPLTTSKSIDIPLLIIHSINDEVIPFSQSLALSNHFYKSKKLEIKGNHLNYMLFKSSYLSILKFFKKNRKFNYLKLHPKIKDKNILIKSNRAIKI